MVQQEPIDEANIKLPRWAPEGTDAQAVACAVNSGTLDESVKSYNKFLESNQTIKHKYGHAYVKGARNLRSNFTRLIKRINLYNANKADPKTGNRNFPKRPDVVGDIPQDKLEANGEQFNPGREGEYENAVQEERDKLNRKNIFDIEDEETDSEFSVDSEEDIDDGSLSVIDTTDQVPPIVEEDYPPDPEEQLPEELYQEEMTPRRKVRNQDAIAYAVLRPVIVVMEANDPQYEAYHRTHSRDILGIRVDIPRGIHPTAFSARVTSCRTKIEFTTTTIQSRYDSIHTIGNKLATCRYGGNIINAFDKALKIDWTKAVGPNKSADVNTWSINLPVKIEKRPANPCEDWVPTPPGFNGFVNVVEEDHSIFWTGFYLVEEDPNMEDPMNSLGGMVDVSYQTRSNPMGTYEMQQTRMENMERFSAGRERRAAPPSVDPGHRRRYDHDEMSIDSSLDDDTSIPPPAEEERRRWMKWDAKRRARAEDKAKAGRRAAHKGTSRKEARRPTPTEDERKPAAKTRGPFSDAASAMSGAHKTTHSTRTHRSKKDDDGFYNYKYVPREHRPSKYDSRRQESEEDFEEITVEDDSAKGSRSGRGSLV